jgi:succinate dehydrogenase / fumarate reductase, membrane anchor subunit
VEPDPVRRPKAAERFEVYTWLYMRVSGLLLVLMVLTHFGIMHLYYGVAHIDFNVVAARYGTPFWRIYDLVLVLLAVTHGMNGAKMLIDDYIHPRSWRTAVLCLVWAIGFIFLVMGGFTILTFRVK